MSDAQWVRLSRQASLFIAPKGLKFEAECARLARKANVLWDETDDSVSDLLEDITAKAAAAHILLDWRGVTLRGVPNLPYTAERGYEAMLCAPRFLSDVLKASEDLSTDSERVLKAAVKMFEWQLRWGEGLDALRLSYKRTGEVPKALREQPDATKDVMFYLDCFHKLNRFRSSTGFGLNPITYSDVSSFAFDLEYEKGSSDFLFFVDVMTSLDSVFLKHYSEKSEAKSRSKAATPKNRRR